MHAVRAELQGALVSANDRWQANLIDGAGDQHQGRAAGKFSDQLHVFGTIPFGRSGCVFVGVDRILAEADDAGWKFRVADGKH